MIRLVVLLSLLAFSLACKPSSSTSASATTASTAGGAGAGGAGTGGTGTGGTGTGATGTGGTGTGGTGTGGTGTGGTGTGGKRKREVEQAHVLVETNLRFNPALNSIFERAFKQGVEQHAHKHGVMYNHDMVYGRTERIGHKFAMGYRIFGADCEQLEKFISTGKKETDLIGVVFAMCNGRLMVL